LVSQGLQTMPVFWRLQHKCVDEVVRRALWLHVGPMKMIDKLPG